MDRAEATGLGVALVAHAALLAALSQGLQNARLPLFQANPIEVSFADEAGLISTAPTPSQVPPAPSMAPELGAPEQAAPAPADTVAPPRPDRPSNVPREKAAPPAPPQKQKGGRSGDKSADRGTRFDDDFMKGINPDPSASRSDEVPASSIGPAIQSSLAAELRRQLKPHWRAPTGADVELIRTVVLARLARDGSIIGEPRVLEQTGVNASNRSQAALHRERAIRAVQLAAPFNFKAEYYQAWREIKPVFDKRF